MEKNKLLISMGITAVFSGVIIASTEIVRADDTTGVLMYRLYNRNSGEHFYTKDGTEKQNLVNVGWKYEGIGWYAPTEGSPVYRLYNSNAGDHHYTLSKKEKDNLVKVGWKYEGIGWYSADTTTGEKLYRAYNPNARAGSHNYTRSWEEQSSLIKVGWKDEGIAWYGIKQANPTITGVSDTVLNQTTESIDSLKGIKATDFLGTTLKVTVSGEINYKVAGTYTLTYTAVDSYGNKATATRKVTVKAVANPTITGVSDTTISQTTAAFDAKKGIVAKDSTGKEISYQVSGEVNTKVAGTYTLTYTTVDSYGNKATATRKVTVKAVANPTITGIKNLEFKKSSNNFNYDSGVKATDYSGQEINYKIETDLPKTNPKSGEYTVTYTAEDVFGNQATKVQKVTIINDLKPTFSGVEDSKVNIIIGSFDVNSGVQAIDGDGNQLNYTVDGKIDFTKVGENSLTYRAVDKVGNETVITRKIEVFEVKPSSIEINGENLMRTNTVNQLNFNVYPVDSYDKKLTWSSSNPNVATVDSSGKVTSLAEGEVTITANTNNGVKKSFDITVSDEINGNLSAYSQITINNIMTSLSISFNSQDERELTVTNVEISDGGWPTTYSKEKLEKSGIATKIASYGSFGISLSTKLGYFVGETTIKLTVITNEGIEKVFEYQL